MNDEHLPWQLHPSLKPDRLTVIAQTFERVWSTVSALHEPQMGDTSWSLCCRAYSRTCYELSRLAQGEHRVWLRIVRDTGLAYLFKIGAVPFKFLRSHPDRTIPRHRTAKDIEATERQLFDLTERPEIANLLPRFIIETGKGWKVSRVVLGWVDARGKSHYPYSIPLEAAVVPVTVTKPAATKLPAAVLGFDQAKRKKRQEDKVE